MRRAALADRRRPLRLRRGRPRALRRRAESALLLPLPEAFGAIDGGTFDATGHRVGQAQMSVVKRADGRIELLARSGIEGSARTQASALMEPAQDGRALRLLSQRSESFDESGRVARPPLDRPRAAHRALRRAGRRGAADAERRAAGARPRRERAAQPALPAARARRDGGGRVPVPPLPVRRAPGRRARGASPPARRSEGLVEVRTQLDLGPLLSSVAAPFLPTLSFWFDRAHPGAWVAHRMPLFSKGPTVLVVRSGVSPARLMPDVGARRSLETTKAPRLEQPRGLCERDPTVALLSHRETRQYHRRSRA